MKYNYTVLFEKHNYALIERGDKYPEYAVVNGLKPESERKYEGSDWDYTCEYIEHTPQGLSAMLDFFRLKTEENYVERSRLKELATLFKDKLIQDNKSSIMEYFKDVCEMDKNEMEFLGIEVMDSEKIADILLNMTLGMDLMNELGMYDEAVQVLQSEIGKLDEDSYLRNTLKNIATENKNLYKSKIIETD